MSDSSSDSFDGLAFDERTTTENFQQRLIQAQYNDEENEPLNNNSIVCLNLGAISLSRYSLGSLIIEIHGLLYER
jgi:hypothetical protein